MSRCICRCLEDRLARERAVGSRISLRRADRSVARGSPGQASGRPVAPCQPGSLEPESASGAVLSTGEAGPCRRSNGDNAAPGECA